MSRRIGIQEVDQVEVDLWEDDGGGLFHAKPASRSVAKQGQPLMEAFEKAVEENDSDKAVAVIGEVLDLRLSPANGKRTKASTIVARKWEQDAVSVDQLVGLMNQLGEADRPT